MEVIRFDMLQTILIAVLLLLLGNKIRETFPVLKRYCIPAAVAGGLLFSLITSILYTRGIIAIEFDSSMIQKFFMNIFFAASGCAAGLKLLKKGGKLVGIFAFLAALLAFLQNAVAVFIGKLVNVPPLIAFMTGSIPMTGGHGNAVAFAPLAESMGAEGAVTVAVAAATFGLVSGCIIGGPIGNMLIKKDKLNVDCNEDVCVEIEEEKPVLAYVDGKRSMTAACMVFIALGFGSLFFQLAKKFLPGVTLPIHVMCMLGGVIVRNVYDAMYGSDNEALYLQVDIIGDISLAVFVSMAIMTMKLWQLTDLAGPLLILLIAQVVLVFLFATQISYRALGKNYDAAIMAVGHTGFGLGAVPVSMVTMKSVCDKYRMSKLAFFVVPIVGGLISNFTNAAIITAFLNFLKP